jgi:endo-1,4-beta-xylanase
MHLLQYENMPPDKQDVIETMRSYDLPVYVTEFDVNLKNVAGSQEQRWNFQADVYRAMLEASLESDVCAGFSVFGLKDDISVWETIPTLEGYSKDSDPLPFDNEENPKPSYYAMLDVLKQYAQK